MMGKVGMTVKALDSYGCDKLYKLVLLLVIISYCMAVGGEPNWKINRLLKLSGEVISLLQV